MIEAVSFYNKAVKLFSKIITNQQDNLNNINKSKM